MLARFGGPCSDGKFLLQKNINKKLDIYMYILYVDIYLCYVYIVIYIYSYIYI